MESYSLVDWLRVSILACFNVLFKWDSHQAYLAEMGIDGPDFPDNMEYLLTIVQPTTGILLNAYANHSERFDKYVTEKEPTKGLRQLDS